MKNNDRVKIKGFAIPGYTGTGQVLDSNPNAYGLLKVRLDVETGFPRNNNPAYYSLSELVLI